MTFTEQQIKVGNRRLLKLAEFIRTVPKKHFDMDNIIRTEAEVGKEANALRYALKGEDCHTAACAIGWCPIVFPRLFTFDGYGMVVERKSRRYDFQAAEIVFALSSPESYKLFSPTPGNNTPSQVARNLTKFVRRREKELTHA